MPDIPNTDNPTVAAIAAALKIAEQRRGDPRNITARETGFQGYLERFLIAYMSIAEAVDGVEPPSQLIKLQ